MMTELKRAHENNLLQSSIVADVIVFGVLFLISLYR